MYFGAKIDVGFPFNKHRAEDTGGWVGPINIVMAQDMNDGQGSRLTLSPPQQPQQDDDAAVVLDRYVSRYVQTPSTDIFVCLPTAHWYGRKIFER
jgi:hypothetical protein